MVATVRIRPDAANGDAYDPSYRSSIWDFVPKHNPHRVCVPQYFSERLNWDPDANPHGDPVTFFLANANHLAFCNECTPLVNTTRYQSRHH